jgi:hypothetical protein
MADVWFAKDVTMQIVDADTVAIDAATTLDAEFSAASAYGVSVKNLHSYAKDVTITEPEGSIDKIDLLGVDGNGFQNAQLDHKPYGLASITGTMLLDGDEVLEPYVAGLGAPITGGYTRYQVGRRLTGNVPNVSARKQCSVLVNLDDSTDEVNFVLDDAWFVKLGDKKISGADGHWEQEFEIVCLPKDFYIEYKN